jgi:hypothetical protein
VIKDTPSSETLGKVGPDNPVGGLRPVVHVIDEDERACEQDQRQRGAGDQQPKTHRQ